MLYLDYSLPSSIGFSRSEVIIDFLSIEKGNYHVEAERQSIRLASCDRDGTTFINQICLYGNLFGIRFSSTFGSSFISRIKIYNWKTGDPISVNLPIVLLKVCR